MSVVGSTHSEELFIGCLFGVEWPALAEDELSTEVTAEASGLQGPHGINQIKHLI